MFSSFTNLYSGSVQVHLRLPISEKIHFVPIWIIDALSESIKECFQTFSMWKVFQYFSLKQKAKLYLSWNIVFLYRMCFNGVYFIWKEIDTNFEEVTIRKSLGCPLKISFYVFATFANGVEGIFFTNETFRGTVTLRLVSQNLLNFVGNGS